MNKRRWSLLLLLAVALFWLGQGTWAAAGKGASSGTSAATAAAATPADATATPTPAPTPTAVLPSTPVTGPNPPVVMDAAQSTQAPGQSKKTGVTRDQLYPEKFQKVAPSEQKAAAKRLAAMGMLPGAAGLGGVNAAAAFAPLPGIEGPGGVPHYFGPYGNWAFSPLPSAGIALTVDQGGAGYTHPLVAISDVYGTGIATATIDPATQIDPLTGAITAVTLAGGSSGFHVPFVTVTDDPTLCGDTANGQPPCGAGAVITATLDLATLTGGMAKFVDSLPGLTPAGANNLGQYIPIAAKEEWCSRPEAIAYAAQSGVPCVPADYYEIALVEYEEQMHSALQPTRLRGYVQLSTATVPGAQFALVNPRDNSAIMRPDGAGGLTPALAVDRPHYLGPLILAQGRVHGIEATDPKGAPKAVRIKFYNLLPAGAGGNLFLPVDETVPGSGYGPSVPGSLPGDKFPQSRATIHLHGNNTVWLSDGNTHQWISPLGENTPYPAGVSARNVPDMTGCASDPANPLLPGSSGCMSFYYTNAQSARLQFYHDHAHGITRLNVYGGEAAGYLVTDQVEKDLMDGTNFTRVNLGCSDTNGSGTAGDFPGECPKVLPGFGVPLVIQDKAFVDPETVFAQDPTWAWGPGPIDPNTGYPTPRNGDLWYPHVYMTVQNPWDPTGTNGFGRWHYGPWFNPPTPECVNGLPIGCIAVGPVPNEYYQPVCDGLPDPVHATCTAPWEPPLRPGVPNPSIPGESFLDTALVNGTAYPYLVVEPKAYRFRILNAANDRFWNLQLYQAFDKAGFQVGDGTPSLPSTAATPCTYVFDPANPGAPNPCTEVKMVPVAGFPNQLTDTLSGVPDPTTAGPPWVLIGTEGGFVPAPVVVPSQPIGWNLDMAYFAFGVVNQHSLFLGSAERADVLVDFTNFAGRTLILYNDSPAPVPAGAAPYDYYTGDYDGVDAGGAPNTQPGYGPNTRTIMQIRVAGQCADPLDCAPVDLTRLNSVWAKSGTKRGVFEVSQETIVIPQEVYGTAYNNPNFPKNSSQWVLNVQDQQKTFTPIGADGVLAPAPVTIPFEMKGMHDEMGGVYDTEFGRMSGMLGITNPNSPVHVLIPYGYSAPPTDVVKGTLESAKIGELADGTQIWRIFHNGVDTHPIHTHLFHAQVINRVDQSGQVTAGTLPVDLLDVGWKDTVKINPLEITYLALRPTVPTPSQVPFEVPNSIRLIDPGLPEGATLMPPAPAGWFDPLGNPLPDLTNHYVNFGWEYVWHCHILSHEEMDFMHALVFAVPPRAANRLSAAVNIANNPSVTLNWFDNSTQEVQYTIQRATNSTFTSGLTAIPIIPANPATTGLMSYEDRTVVSSTNYWYRVLAVGPVVGDVSLANFPTLAADSFATTCDPNVPTSCPGVEYVAVTIGAPPAAGPSAPINFAFTLLAGPQVRLTWTDTARDETGFVVERCTGVGCVNFVQIAAPGPRNNTGGVTYTDTAVAFNTTYVYRVGAFNAAGTTYAAAPLTVVVPAAPVAPTNFTVTASPVGNRYTATLTWVPPAGNFTNFTIQRATNLSFTAGLNTSTVTGTPTGTGALTTQQTGLARNTVYYYRIRSNNSAGSSAWTNALPFPIRTGN